MSDKLSIPLPSGFATQLHNIPNIDADALLNALDTAPEVSVRLNPRKPSCAFADTETQPVEWCSEGLYLPSRPSFTLMPQIHAGAFYVQDASSMILSSVIKKIATRPCCVLDLCAAPGGKTTAALAALHEGSMMVANEVMTPRAKILRENIIKWGRPDVIVTSAPAEAFGRLGAAFDIIIADVPCSGEGMMRKDDEARRQWSEGLVKQCAGLQRSILDDVLPALRPGGFLIYSTCTFNTSEDEENVRYLMEHHHLENIPVDDFPAIIPRSVTDDVAALRFMPHVTRGEGLFCAILRKPDDAESVRLRRAKPLKPEANREAAQWIEGNRSLYRFGEALYALSDDAASMASLLADARIKMLRPGVEVAVMKGRDFVPSPTLPLCDSFARNKFPEVELSLDDARAYLRHEAVVMPQDTPKGPVTVTYDGLPLGFVKNLGNRANNLFPKEWRVLMK